MATKSKTFALMLSYVPEMQERRQPHRAGHLERLKQRAAEGNLLLAGALNDPSDTGLILVRAESHGEVYAWLAEDPYMQAGLISAVSVREITVAVTGG